MALVDFALTGRPNMMPQDPGGNDHPVREPRTVRFARRDGKYSLDRSFCTLGGCLPPPGSENSGLRLRIQREVEPSRMRPFSAESVGQRRGWASGPLVG